MCIRDRFYYLAVNVFLSICRAGQRSIASQILVCHGFHCHHVKFGTHAVAGNHGSCKLGCLLNIVGSTCGYFPEFHFFRCTSTGKSSNLIFNFLFGHQILITGFQLHGITKGSGGSWNNGNLLYRCRICLLYTSRCV